MNNHCCDCRLDHGVVVIRGCIIFALNVLFVRYVINVDVFDPLDGYTGVLVDCLQQLKNCEIELVKVALDGRVGSPVNH
ncbi:hypothetical protein D3C80_1365900 [compost metagenome]